MACIQITHVTKTGRWGAQPQEDFAQHGTRSTFRLWAYSCSCGAAESGYPDEHRAQLAAQLHRAVAALSA